MVTALTMWSSGQDHLSLERLTSENCFCRRTGHGPEWSLGAEQGWGELLT